MDIETRIRQFEQMAEADPDNELGHFSLGKAYAEAKRFDDAIDSFQRALNINPNLSKVYQLLGDAYEKTGQRDKAVETMTNGVLVAQKQGDRMPRDAMAGILQEWGAPVPEQGAAPQRADDASTPTAAGFSCARCGRPTGRLEKPPFKGPLGQQIYENVCTSCWREWIAMGTKVINELGLVLSSPQGQETYDQYMVEFLQLENR